jgi:cell division protein FtsN
MARDYKHKARAKPAPTKAPGWLWFVVGLAVGLFSAYLAFLAGVEPVPAPQPSVAAVPAPPKPPPRATPARKQKAPETKTRFEFYTILPEREVQVPDFEIAPRASKSEKPEVAPSSYVLQVGSFRRLEEADRLKASLALLGLQAEIQSVAITGGDTWHRVRLGPYRQLKTLSETRSRLNENGITAMVVKNRN